MTYPQFPTLSAAAFPNKRQPRVSSLRQKAISGRETFQPLWATPLYDYTIDVTALDASGNARGGIAGGEYQTLLGFWNQTMTAPGGVFAYVDPADNAVAAQALGTGDGATTSFQLVRTLGGFDDPVLDPVCGPNVPATGSDAGDFQGGTTVGTDAGDFQGATTIGSDAGYFSTLQVYAAGLLAPWTFSGGSGDASGGIVVIAPAPADGVALTWTGAFRWLCRFAEDSLALSEFMFQLYEMKQLKFSTVRL